MKEVIEQIEWTEEDQMEFDRSFEEFIDMYEKKAGLDATFRLVENLRKNVSKN